MSRRPLDRDPVGRGRPSGSDEGPRDSARASPSSIASSCNDLIGGLRQERRRIPGAASPPAARRPPTAMSRRSRRSSDHRTAPPRRIAVHHRDEQTRTEEIGSGEGSADRRHRSRTRCGMSVWQRLSGLDASFLYLETRSQLMHVIGPAQVDQHGARRLFLHQDAAKLERRVSAMPTFRCKLDNSTPTSTIRSGIEDDDRHPTSRPPGGGSWFLRWCGATRQLVDRPADIYRGKPRRELARSRGWRTVGSLPRCVSITRAPRCHERPKCSSSSALSRRAPPRSGQTPRNRRAVVADDHRGDPRDELLGRPVAMAKLLRHARAPFALAASFAFGQRDARPFRRAAHAIQPADHHRSIALSQLSLQDVKRVRTGSGVKINDAGARHGSAARCAPT